jgi:hypothetical protein
MSHHYPRGPLGAFSSRAYSVCTLAVCTLALVACVTAPSVPQLWQAEAGEACAVSYPQLQRCECGCTGSICTTGTLGVVQCDTVRARQEASLLPTRNALVP